MTVGRLVAYSLLFLALWLFFAEKSRDAPYRERHQLDRIVPETLTKDEFSWESITPTEELIWTNCYSNHQCARLKVPLDYAHPEGRSAAIAMIRVHSGVPHDSPRYRGPVLINPGGPGESGVNIVAWKGQLLSTIIGPEFDIIGFDPRGIARSTPRASFFANRAEREIWSVDDARSKSMNASTDALSRAWARGMVIGQLAGERDDGSLRFITTDHTARDMLQIVRAHGEEKLQYWGFSYGSVLGAAFASMFPQNVGRLVIDGVEDSENYFATLWDNNLLDTDKVWMAFIDGCVAAGPSGCAFFAPTAAEISDNVEKLSESLRSRPIPVRTDTSFGVVDYSRLRRTIFESLYSPYAMFPILAQALADVARGNGTTLFKMLEIPAFECACDAAQHQFEFVSEGFPAVLCNDGKRISPEYDEVLARYQSLSKTSNWADVWAPIPLQCLAWPDFPKNHFQGPFVANTSFPLLLVTTTADPVTPLWAANKMSQGFPGSVVLTQDSAGHCSISGVSLCTHKYIRQYFFDGTLPAPGTICAVDVPPFPTSDFAMDDPQAPLGVSAADLHLFDAVQKLAKTFGRRFPLGI
ncbi:TAP-like protein-domain-containing protein [Mycena galopus ATCC 62051]|nr:TAP-like protein-domain-containing protein [Mycena galopus ATCC 62051]